MSSRLWCSSTKLSMHPWKDRKAAGKLLAHKLREYKDSDCVVYALPRGGVVTAAEIAEYLDCPLDLVITRKIGHPYNPEYAIGAITEAGASIWNEEERKSVNPEWLIQETQRQLHEAQRRKQLYTTGRSSLSAHNKVAILVDDGIATGLTIKAALLNIQQQKPSGIVVAVPVGPHEVIEELKTSGSRVVTLIDPLIYAGAVGAYYKEFDQVTDQEVLSILKNAKPQ